MSIADVVVGPRLELHASNMASRSFREAIIRMVTTEYEKEGIDSDRFPFDIGFRPAQLEQSARSLTIQFQLQDASFGHLSCRSPANGSDQRAKEMTGAERSTFCIPRLPLKLWKEAHGVRRHVRRLGRAIRWPLATRYRRSPVLVQTSGSDGGRRSSDTNCRTVNAAGIAVQSITPLSKPAAWGSATVPFLHLRCAISEKHNLEQVSRKVPAHAFTGCHPSGSFPGKALALPSIHLLLRDCGGDANHCVLWTSHAYGRGGQPVGEGGTEIDTSLSRFALGRTMRGSGSAWEDNPHVADVEAVGRIDVVPTILETVCQVTGMGFAAIARVTEERWIACSVRDTISFGLKPGGELKLETTICHEIRQVGDPVIISNVPDDPVYGTHHTPALYGFRSYISFPIYLPDGAFFGTLCAIDPEPRDLGKPEIHGIFRMFARLIGVTLDQAKRLADSEAELAAQQEAAELREQFIAVMGHDLRNPLAAIQAGITLLERQPPQERAAMLLSQMRSSGDRMASLIADVLDLARGRLGGGMALKRKPVFIDAIVRQVVAELASTHPEHMISAECSTSLAINCDPDRIAQLLSNLLGNALTHGASSEPVRVLCDAEDGQFMLSVINGGGKIPDQAMAGLFRPFVRGKAAADREGLGLGLYIASEIAAAHDGNLTVRSTSEETCFCLSMPLR